MKQSPIVEDRIPMQAVEALRQELGGRLIAVVLFGSRARGDTRVESDWDLLVIAEGLPERPLDRHALLYSPLLNHPGPISMIALTREEFESHVSSLYLDIALDGRRLYDPTRYAAERLARLRRLIEEGGLYRERTPAGDSWKWRTPPLGPWVVTWEKIGEIGE